MKGKCVENLKGGCDYLFIMSQKKIIRLKLALSVMNFWDYLYLQKGSWEVVIIFPSCHQRKSLRIKFAFKCHEFLGLPSSPKLKMGFHTN